MSKKKSTDKDIIPVPEKLDQKNPNYKRLKHHKTILRNVDSERRRNVSTILKKMDGLDPEAGE
jgi:hypothetical protein